MRIGSIVAGIEQRLLTQLARAEADSAASSLRLSTGLKINSPSDDPSGFLHLQLLEQQRSRTNDALTQIQAAADLASETQLTIDAIRTQLDTIRTTLLTDEDQTLTAAERQTAQSTIDAAINQIAALLTTEISGKRVLDGSTDFTFSGLNSSQIEQIQVYALADNEITANVSSTATTAELTYTGSAGQATSTASLTVSGQRGSTTIDVSSSQTLTSLRDSINQDSHKTGVTASVSGDVLTFESVEYGSDADIEIVVNSGTFAVAGGNGDGTANGTDAVATINGQSYTGEGNRFLVNDRGFRFAVEFEAGFTGAVSTVTVTDEDVLQFALSPDIARRDGLGLKGLQPAQFRGLSGSLDDLLSGGGLSGLDSNTSQAIRVIDEALDRLSITEGQVDGFADATVAAPQSLFTDILDNVDDALAEFAVNETEETLLLARNQSLVENTVASLSILQQQRQGILQILRQAAGL